MPLPQKMSPFVFGVVHQKASNNITNILIITYSKFYLVTASDFCGLSA